MLEAFFLLCRGTEDMDNPAINKNAPEMQNAIRLRDLARTLKYSQVVKHFVYKAEFREWREIQRKANKVVSRIRDVSIAQKDLFAMRMLRSWTNLTQRHEILQ